ncbi:MAG: redoxin domain-containing protein, partial [Candidatus Omnitrophica bacterium]|nr:redoxin domain-containing protein [Candidatus Omnitrophota bacterium]
MMEWQKPKTKPWLRVTAFLTALIFTYNTCWADNASLIHSNTQKNNLPASDIASAAMTSAPKSFFDSLQLSDSIGQIKSTFQGSRSRIIVHIQDAHVNEEAQRNIANIIDYFAANHGLRWANLEGADGELYTELFSIFPDQKARRDVADYFLKQGRLTGPEYLAVTSRSDLKLYGIEDKAIYEENRQAYLDSLEYKDRDEAVLSELEKVLNGVTRFVFSPELRELNRRRSGFYEEGRELVAYVRYLVETAGKLNITLDDYPGLHSLLSLIDLEKQIDFDKAETEISQLTDDLKKILSREKLSRFLTNTIQFRMKKMKRADYYGYLQEEVQGLPPTGAPAGGYENVLHYLQYMRLFDSIQLDVFDEIEGLEKGIKNKLFRNPTEVTLDHQWRLFEIMKKMFDFSLTKQDAEFFYRYREEFKASTFRDFLTPLLAQYHFSFGLPAKMEVLDQDLARIEKFYGAALKRDHILIERAIEKMEVENQNIAAIVTGGFHTPGIEKYLREHDYSYIVVQPKIVTAIDTKKEAELYQNALRQSPMNMERFLVESYFPPKSAVLNDPRFQLSAGTTILSQSESRIALRNLVKNPESVWKNAPHVHEVSLWLLMLIVSLFNAGDASALPSVKNSQIPPADQRLMKRILTPFRRIVFDDQGNKAYSKDARGNYWAIAQYRQNSRSEVRAAFGGRRSNFETMEVGLAGDRNLYASIIPAHLVSREVLSRMEAQQKRAEMRVKVSGDLEKILSVVEEGRRPLTIQNFYTDYRTGLIDEAESEYAAWLLLHVLGLRSEHILKLEIKWVEAQPPAGYVNFLENTEDIILDRQAGKLVDRVLDFMGIEEAKETRDDLKARIHQELFGEDGIMQFIRKKSPKSSLLSDRILAELQVDHTILLKSSEASQVTPVPGTPVVEQAVKSEPVIPAVSAKSTEGTKTIPATVAGEAPATDKPAESAVKAVEPAAVSPPAPTPQAPKSFIQKILAFFGVILVSWWLTPLRWTFRQLRETVTEKNKARADKNAAKQLEVRRKLGVEATALGLSADKLADRKTTEIQKMIKSARKIGGIFAAAQKKLMKGLVKLEKTKPNVTTAAAYTAQIIAYLGAEGVIAKTIADVEAGIKKKQSFAGIYEQIGGRVRDEFETSLEKKLRKLLEPVETLGLIPAVEPPAPTNKDLLPILQSEMRSNLDDLHKRALALHAAAEAAAKQVQPQPEPLVTPEPTPVESAQSVTATQEVAAVEEPAQVPAVEKFRSTLFEIVDWTVKIAASILVGRIGAWIITFLILKMSAGPVERPVTPLTPPAPAAARVELAVNEIPERKALPAVLPNVEGEKPGLQGPEAPPTDRIPVEPTIPLRPSSTPEAPKPFDPNSLPDVPKVADTPDPKATQPKQAKQASEEVEARMRAEREANLKHIHNLRRAFESGILNRAAIVPGQTVVNPKEFRMGFDASGRKFSYAELHKAWKPGDGNLLMFIERTDGKTEDEIITPEILGQLEKVARPKSPGHRSVTIYVIPVPEGFFRTRYPNTHGNIVTIFNRHPIFNGLPPDEVVAKDTERPPVVLGPGVSDLNFSTPIRLPNGSVVRTLKDLMQHYDSVRIDVVAEWCTQCPSNVRNLADNAATLRAQGIFPIVVATDPGDVRKIPTSANWANSLGDLPLTSAAINVSQYPTVIDYVNVNNVTQRRSELRSVIPAAPSTGSVPDYSRFQPKAWMSWVRLGVLLISGVIVYFFIAVPLAPYLATYFVTTLIQPLMGVFLSKIAILMISIGLMHMVMNLIDTISGAFRTNGPPSVFSRKDVMLDYLLALGITREDRDALLERKGYTVDSVSTRRLWAIIRQIERSQEETFELNEQVHHQKARGPRNIFYHIRMVSNQGPEHPIWGKLPYLPQAAVIGFGKWASQNFTSLKSIATMVLAIPMIPYHLAESFFLTFFLPQFKWNFLSLRPNQLRPEQVLRMIDYYLPQAPPKPRPSADRFMIGVEFIRGILWDNAIIHRGSSRFLSKRLYLSGIGLVGWYFVLRYVEFLMIPVFPAIAGLHFFTFYAWISSVITVIGLYAPKYIAKLQLQFISRKWVKDTNEDMDAQIRADLQKLADVNLLQSKEFGLVLEAFMKKLAASDAVTQQVTYAFLQKHLEPLIRWKRLALTTEADYAYYGKMIRPESTGPPTYSYRALSIPVLGPILSWIATPYALRSLWSFLFSPKTYFEFLPAMIFWNSLGMSLVLPLEIEFAMEGGAWIDTKVDSVTDHKWRSVSDEGEAMDRAAQGANTPDGILKAVALQAQPNGLSLEETEVLHALTKEKTVHEVLDLNIQGKEDEAAQILKDIVHEETHRFKAVHTLVSMIEVEALGMGGEVSSAVKEMATRLFGTAPTLPDGTSIILPYYSQREQLAMRDLNISMYQMSMSDYAHDVAEKISGAEKEVLESEILALRTDPKIESQGSLYVYELALNRFAAKKLGQSKDSAADIQKKIKENRDAIENHDSQRNIQEAMYLIDQIVTGKFVDSTGRHLDFVWEKDPATGAVNTRFERADPSNPQNHDSFVYEGQWTKKPADESSLVAIYHYVNDRLHSTTRVEKGVKTVYYHQPVPGKDEIRPTAVVKLKEDGKTVDLAVFITYEGDEVLSDYYDFSAPTPMEGLAAFLSSTKDMMTTLSDSAQAKIEWAKNLIPQDIKDAFKKDLAKTIEIKDGVPQRPVLRPFVREVKNQQGVVIRKESTGIEDGKNVRLVVEEREGDLIKSRTLYPDDLERRENRMLNAAGLPTRVMTKNYLYEITYNDKGEKTAVLESRKNAQGLFVLIVQRFYENGKEVRIVQAPGDPINATTTFILKNLLGERANQRIERVYKGVQLEDSKDKAYIDREFVRRDEKSEWLLKEESKFGFEKDKPVLDHLERFFIDFVTGEYWREYLETRNTIQKFSRSLDQKGKLQFWIVDDYEKLAAGKGLLSPLLLLPQVTGEGLSHPGPQPGPPPQKEALEEKEKSEEKPRWLSRRGYDPQERVVWQTANPDTPGAITLYQDPSFADGSYNVRYYQGQVDGVEKDIDTKAHPLLRNVLFNEAHQVIKQEELNPKTGKVATTFYFENGILQRYTRHGEDGKVLATHVSKKNRDFTRTENIFFQDIPAAPTTEEEWTSYISFRVKNNLDQLAEWAKDWKLKDGIKTNKPDAAMREAKRLTDKAKEDQEKAEQAAKKVEELKAKRAREEELKKAADLKKAAEPVPVQPKKADEPAKPGEAKKIEEPKKPEEATKPALATELPPDLEKLRQIHLSMDEREKKWPQALFEEGIRVGVRSDGTTVISVTFNIPQGGDPDREARTKRVEAYFGNEKAGRVYNYALQLGTRVGNAVGLQVGTEVGRKTWSRSKGEAAGRAAGEAAGKAAAEAWGRGFRTDLERIKALAIKISADPEAWGVEPDTQKLGDDSGKLWARFTAHILPTGQAYIVDQNGRILTSKQNEKANIKIQGVTTSGQTRADELRTIFSDKSSNIQIAAASPIRPISAQTEKEAPKQVAQATPKAEAPKATAPKAAVVDPYEAQIREAEAQAAALKKQAEESAAKAAEQNLKVEQMHGGTSSWKVVNGVPVFSGPQDDLKGESPLDVIGRTVRAAALNHEALDGPAIEERIQKEILKMIYSGLSFEEMVTISSINAQKWREAHPEEEAPEPEKTESGQISTTKVTPIPPLPPAAEHMKETTMPVKDLFEGMPVKVEGVQGNLYLKETLPNKVKEYMDSGHMHNFFQAAPTVQDGQLRAIMMEWYYDDGLTRVGKAIEIFQRAYLDAKSKLPTDRGPPTPDVERQIRKQALEYAIGYLSDSFVKHPSYRQHFIEQAANAAATSGPMGAASEIPQAVEAFSEKGIARAQAMFRELLTPVTEVEENEITGENIRPFEPKLSYKAEPYSVSNLSLKEKINFDIAKADGSALPFEMLAPGKAVILVYANRDNTQLRPIIARLNEIQQRFSKDNVQIVFVYPRAVDETLRAWMQREKMQFPVFHDAKGDLGLKQPVVRVLDRNGKEIKNQIPSDNDIRKMLGQPTQEGQAEKIRLSNEQVRAAQAFNAKLQELSTIDARKYLQGIGADTRNLKDEQVQQMAEEHMLRWIRLSHKKIIDERWPGYGYWDESNANLPDHKIQDSNLRQSLREEAVNRINGEIKRRGWMKPATIDSLTVEQVWILSQWQLQPDKRLKDIFQARGQVEVTQYNDIKERMFRVGIGMSLLSFPPIPGLILQFGFSRTVSQSAPTQPYDVEKMRLGYDVGLTHEYVAIKNQMFYISTIEAEMSSAEARAGRLQFERARAKKVYEAAVRNNDATAKNYFQVDLELRKGILRAQEEQEKARNKLRTLLRAPMMLAWPSQKEGEKDAQTAKIGFAKPIKTVDWKAAEQAIRPDGTVDMDKFYRASNIDRESANAILRSAGIVINANDLSHTLEIQNARANALFRVTEAQYQIASKLPEVKVTKQVAFPFPISFSVSKLTIYRNLNTVSPREFAKAVNSIQQVYWLRHQVEQEATDAKLVARQATRNVNAWNESLKTIEKKSLDLDISRAQRNLNSSSETLDTAERHSYFEQRILGESARFNKALTSLEGVSARAKHIENRLVTNFGLTPQNANEQLLAMTDETMKEMANKEYPEIIRMTHKVIFEVIIAHPSWVEQAMKTYEAKAVQLGSPKEGFMAVVRDLQAQGKLKTDGLEVAQELADQIEDKPETLALDNPDEVFNLAVKNDPAYAMIQSNIMAGKYKLVDALVKQPYFQVRKIQATPAEIVDAVIKTGGVNYDQIKLESYEKKIQNYKDTSAAYKKYVQDHNAYYAKKTGPIPAPVIDAGIKRGFLAEALASEFEAIYHRHIMEYMESPWKNGMKISAWFREQDPETVNLIDLFHRQTLGRDQQGGPMINAQRVRIVRESLNELESKVPGLAGAFVSGDTLSKLLTEHAYSKDQREYQKRYDAFARLRQNSANFLGSSDAIGLVNGGRQTPEEMEALLTGNLEEQMKYISRHQATNMSQTWRHIERDLAILFPGENFYENVSEFDLSWETHMAMRDLQIHRGHQKQRRNFIAKTIVSSVFQIMSAQEQGDFFRQDIANVKKAKELVEKEQEDYRVRSGGKEDERLKAQLGQLETDLAQRQQGLDTLNDNLELAERSILRMLPRQSATRLGVFRDLKSWNDFDKWSSEFLGRKFDRIAGLQEARIYEAYGRAGYFLAMNTNREMTNLKGGNMWHLINNERYWVDGQRQKEIALGQAKGLALWEVSKIQRKQADVSYYGIRRGVEESIGFIKPQRDLTFVENLDPANPPKVETPFEHAYVSLVLDQIWRGQNLLSDDRTRPLGEQKFTSRFLQISGVLEKDPGIQNAATLKAVIGWLKEFGMIYDAELKELSEAEEKAKIRAIFIALRNYNAKLQSVRLTDGGLTRDVREIFDGTKVSKFTNDFLQERRNLVFHQKILDTLPTTSEIGLDPGQEKVKSGEYVLSADNLSVIVNGIPSLREAEQRYLNAVNYAQIVDAHEGSRGRKVTTFFKLGVPFFDESRRLQQNVEITTHTTPKYVQEAQQSYSAGEQMVYAMPEIPDIGRRDGISEGVGFSISFNAINITGGGGAQDSGPASAVSGAPSAGSTSFATPGTSVVVYPSQIQPTSSFQPAGSNGFQISVSPLRFGISFSNTRELFYIAESDNAWKEAEQWKESKALTEVKKELAALSAASHLQRMIDAEQVAALALQKLKEAQKLVAQRKGDVSTEEIGPSESINNDAIRGAELNIKLTAQARVQALRQLKNAFEMTEPRFKLEFFQAGSWTRNYLAHILGVDEKAIVNQQALFQILEESAKNSHQVKIAQIATQRFNNLIRQAHGETTMKRRTTTFVLSFPTIALAVEWTWYKSDGGRGAAKAYLNAQEAAQSQDAQVRAEEEGKGELYEYVLSVLTTQNELKRASLAVAVNYDIYQDLLRKYDPNEANITERHLREAWEHFESSLYAYFQAENFALHAELAFEKLAKDFGALPAIEAAVDKEEIKSLDHLMTGRPFDRGLKERVVSQSRVMEVPDLGPRGAVTRPAPRVLKNVEEEIDFGEKFEELGADPGPPHFDPSQLSPEELAKFESMKQSVRKIFDVGGIPATNDYALNLNTWTHFGYLTVGEAKTLREEKVAASMENLKVTSDPKFSVGDKYGEFFKIIFGEKWKEKSMLELYKEARLSYLKNHPSSADNPFSVDYEESVLRAIPLDRLSHLYERREGKIVVRDRVKVNADFLGRVRAVAAKAIAFERKNEEATLERLSLENLIHGILDLNKETLRKFPTLQDDHAQWLEREDVNSDGYEMSSLDITQDERLIRQQAIIKPMNKHLTEVLGRSVELTLHGRTQDEALLGAAEAILYKQNISAENYFELKTAMMMDRDIAKFSQFFPPLTREGIMDHPAGYLLDKLVRVDFKRAFEALQNSIPAPLRETAKQKGFDILWDEFKAYGDKNAYENHRKRYGFYRDIAQKVELAEAQVRHNILSGRVDFMILRWLMTQTKNDAIKKWIETAKDKPWVAEGQSWKDSKAIQDFLHVIDQRLNTLTAVQEEMNETFDMSGEERLDLNRAEDLGTVSYWADLIEQSKIPPPDFRTLFEYARKNFEQTNKLAEALGEGKLRLRRPDHMGFLIATTIARLEDGWEETKNMIPDMIVVIEDKGLEAVYEHTRDFWESFGETMGQKIPKIEGKFLSMERQSQGRVISFLKDAVRDGWDDTVVKFAGSKLYLDEIAEKDKKAGNDQGRENLLRKATLLELGYVNSTSLSPMLSHLPLTAENVSQNKKSAGAFMGWLMDESERTGHQQRARINAEKIKQEQPRQQLPRPQTQRRQTEILRPVGPQNDNDQDQDQDFDNQADIDDAGQPEVVKVDEKDWAAIYMEILTNTAKREALIKDVLTLEKVLPESERVWTAEKIETGLRKQSAKARGLVSSWIKTRLEYGKWEESEDLAERVAEVIRPDTAPDGALPEIDHGLRDSFYVLQLIQGLPIEGGEFETAYEAFQKEARSGSLTPDQRSWVISWAQLLSDAGSSTDLAKGQMLKDLKDDKGRGHRLALLMHKYGREKDSILTQYYQAFDVLDKDKTLLQGFGETKEGKLMAFSKLYEDKRRWYELWGKLVFLEERYLIKEKLSEEEFVTMLKDRIHWAGRYRELGLVLDNKGKLDPEKVRALNPRLFELEKTIQKPLQYAVLKHIGLPTSLYEASIQEGYVKNFFESEVSGFAALARSAQDHYSVPIEMIDYALLLEPMATSLRENEKSLLIRAQAEGDDFRLGRMEDLEDRKQDINETIRLLRIKNNLKQDTIDNYLAARKKGYENIFRDLVVRFKVFDLIRQFPMIFRDSLTGAPPAKELNLLKGYAELILRVQRDIDYYSKINRSPLHGTQLPSWTRVFLRPLIQYEQNLAKLEEAITKEQDPAKKQAMENEHKVKLEGREALLKKLNEELLNENGSIASTFYNISAARRLPLKLNVDMEEEFIGQFKQRYREPFLTEARKPRAMPDFSAVFEFFGVDPSEPPFSNSYLSYGVEEAPDMVKNLPQFKDKPRWPWYKEFNAEHQAMYAGWQKIKSVYEPWWKSRATIEDLQQAREDFRSVIEFLSTKKETKATWDPREIKKLTSQSGDWLKGVLDSMESSTPEKREDYAVLEEKVLEAFLGKVKSLSEQLEREKATHVEPVGEESKELSKQFGIWVDGLSKKIEVLEPNEDQWAPGFLTWVFKDSKNLEGEELKKVQEARARVEDLETFIFDFDREAETDWRLKELAAREELLKHAKTFQAAVAKRLAEMPLTINPDVKRDLRDFQLALDEMIAEERIYIALISDRHTMSTKDSNYYGAVFMPAQNRQLGAYGVAELAQRLLRSLSYAVQVKAYGLPQPENVNMAMIRLLEQKRIEEP